MRTFSSLDNSNREFLTICLFFYAGEQSVSGTEYRIRDLIMIKNIYSFSRRSKRPPRFLQIKGLHQIKIWKFSPCFTRREDVTVFYGYTGKYPAIFDQLERTLRPSYVLNVNENCTCTPSLICPCH